MKNYQLIAALSFVGISAYAESSRVEMKPPAATAVFVTTPSHSFEIEFRALVLQPTASNLHYAAEAQPLPLPSPDWNIHEISTDYHFGFDVGFGYVCHDTNSHLTLDWIRFHSCDSASNTVALSTNMVGPFFEIGPDASLYKYARGQASFHFDEASLDYGIFVNIGNRLQTNVFGGVSFARIKQTLSSRFTSYDGNTVRTINVPSTFTGAGPQFGLDFSYKMVKGFKLTGTAIGSLLIGPQKNQTNYSALSPALGGVGLTPPNNQSTQVAKKTQVVPGFEGRLGLAYTWGFGKCGMVKLEAGYEAMIYMDAIQSIDMGSEVLTPPVTPDTVGVFARTFQGTSSNFALAGPYVAIEVGF